MDLSIEERAGADGGGRVDLILRGRIDAETSPELEAAVDALLHRGVTTIRLDLAAVGFLSSAGIRTLFNVSRAAKGRAVDLGLPPRPANGLVPRY